jgi:hypothetical protein
LIAWLIDSSPTLMNQKAVDQKGLPALNFSTKKEVNDDLEIQIKKIAQFIGGTTHLTEKIFSFFWSNLVDFQII